MGAHVILVASRKGGAGKTTLTRNLAVAAAREGRGVLVLDLDPQQSLRDWWQGRGKPDIAMLDRDPQPEELRTVLDRAREHLDLVLIDTPPSSTAWLGAALKAVDLVLIPVRPSPDDLRAVGTTLSLVRAAQVPFAFVLSQVPVRARLTEDSARALAAHGRLCPVNLGARVAYAETAASGDGVLESGDAKASREIIQTWAFVQTILKEQSP